MASYNSLLKPYPHKGLCGDRELVESKAQVAQKASKLAELIQKSSHVVVYTGAGVSTAAGIPDFRGPNGVWTLEAQGAVPAADPIRICDARPTFTHRALAELVSRGLVHHIVTQNVDNLHRKSGIPRERLSELHGNVCVEKCERCQQEHVRDFETQSAGFKLTGRFCERVGCGGALQDWCLDWDDELPARELDEAISQTRQADLVICLGTSLRIRPAGNLPLRAVRLNGKPEPGKLAIVNLQKTHLDNRCTLRMFARCDEVLRTVMDKLPTANS